IYHRFFYRYLTGFAQVFRQNFFPVRFCGFSLLFFALSLRILHCKITQQTDPGNHTECYDSHKPCHHPFSTSVSTVSTAPVILESSTRFTTVSFWRNVPSLRRSYSILIQHSLTSSILTCVFPSRSSMAASV